MRMRLKTNRHEMESLREGRIPENHGARCSRSCQHAGTDRTEGSEGKSDGEGRVDLERESNEQQDKVL